MSLALEYLLHDMMQQTLYGPADAFRPLVHLARQIPFILFFLTLVLALAHLPQVSAATSSRNGGAGGEYKIELTDCPSYLPKLENSGNTSVFLVRVRVVVREPENLPELRLKAYLKAKNSTTPASQLYSEEHGDFLYPHISWGKMPLVPVSEDQRLYTVTLRLRLYNYSGYHGYLRYASFGVLDVSMKDMGQGKVVKAEQEEIRLFGGRGVGEEEERSVGTRILVIVNGAFLLREPWLNASFSTVSALAFGDPNDTFAFVPLGGVGLDEESMAMAAKLSLPEHVVRDLILPGSEDGSRHLLLSLFNDSVLLFEGGVACEWGGGLEGEGAEILIRCFINDTRSSTSGLIINEVYYNGIEGVGSPPLESYEWIELYHPGDFIAWFEDLTLTCLTDGTVLSFSLPKLVLEPHTHSTIILGSFPEDERVEILWTLSGKGLIFLEDVETGGVPVVAGDVLADTGGEIVLSSGSLVIDTVSYGFFDGNNEPYLESRPHVNKGSSLARVLNQTSALGLSPALPTPNAANHLHPPKNTTITAFSSPDTSMSVLSDAVLWANESIYIEMYSFSNQDIIDLLVAAKKRQVDIRIILEHDHATPWERGYTTTAASLLHEQGIGVRWSPLGADGDYVFQHAKSLIIDNETVVIMSANFGRTGITRTGGLGNREWGVVVGDHEVAYSFLVKFHVDWRGALDYELYAGAGGAGGGGGGGGGGASDGGGGGDGSDDDEGTWSLPRSSRKSVLPLVFSNESFCFERPEFCVLVDDEQWAWAGLEDEAVSGSGNKGQENERHIEDDEITITPIFSPDSLDPLLGLIANARDSIDMEYMFFDSTWNDSVTTNPLIPALKDAGQRGVMVRLLLDSRPHYNQKTIETLAEANISLAYFNNAFFSSLHNKGMIVDSRAVLVSSINAGHTSIMRNSEAGIIITNRRVAGFYETIFDFDWGLSKKIGHLPPDHPTQPPSHPLFTKVYPDPYAHEDMNEFAVLTNPADNVVDISGWYLTELEHIVAFPQGSRIPPQGQVLVCRDPDVLVSENNIYPDFYYGKNLFRPPGYDSIGPSVHGRQMCFSPSLPMPGHSFGFDVFPAASFGELRLNNGEEELFLLTPEFEIADVVCYTNVSSKGYVGAGFDGTYIPAPSEGTLLVRSVEPGEGTHIDTDSSADWLDPRIRKINQSDFSTKNVSFTGDVTAFTFPEAGVDAIIRELVKAEQSVYINAYQFTHHALLPLLINLRKNGVDVRILLEGFPMEQIPNEEKFILHALHDEGAQIAFMINNLSLNIHDRYLFNHAKYIVIDNSTLIVLSENLKPSGLPTYPGKTIGNRGWGAVIHSKEAASYFSEVFFTDLDLRMKDIFPFSPGHHQYGAPPGDFSLEDLVGEEEYARFRERLSLVHLSLGEFRERLFPWERENTCVERNGCRSFAGEFHLQCFLGPDNLALADDPILDLIRSAEKSINIELLSCKPDWTRYGNILPNRYLEELFKKAKEGVLVRVILDTRYNNLSATADNHDCFLYIKERIALENLHPFFKIKLYNGTDFIKVHNKGAVVDGERVLLGSINWTPGGILENREAGIVITNKDVAGFFNSSFNNDWNLSCLPTQEKSAWLGNNPCFLGLLCCVILILIIGYSRRKSLCWRGGGLFPRETQEEHCRVAERRCVLCFGTN